MVSVQNLGVTIYVPDVYVSVSGSVMSTVGTMNSSSVGTGSDIVFNSIQPAEKIATALTIIPIAILALMETQGRQGMKMWFTRGTNSSPVILFTIMNMFGERL